MERYRVRVGSDAPYVMGTDDLDEALEAARQLSLTSNIKRGRVQESMYGDVVARFEWGERV